MYSDSEIENAVASGAIDRDAAIRLRAAISAQRHSDPADDEQFRLVTSFNDIFVTIAAGLVIFALGTTIGGIAVAAASWGLAEYFTRRKRMALPSIFLLVCFVGGLFAFLYRLFAGWTLDGGGVPTDETSVLFFVGVAVAGLLTAVGAGLHWRRFHVPITIAAGAMALAVVAGSVFMLLMSLLNVELQTSFRLLQWFSFAMGIVIFAYAMRWDLQDPDRITRRSDVAFWLHLAASPLIVHPLFIEIAMLGAGAEGSEILAAVLAIILYAGLGALALIVDRRAVLVSALAYVVAAIAVILRSDGAVATNISTSGAVIGALLLAMSVFWRPLRHALLKGLPARWRIRLPDAAAG